MRMGPLPSTIDLAAGRRRWTRSPPRRWSRSTGYSCRTRWRRCRSSCRPGRCLISRRRSKTSSSVRRSTAWRCTVSEKPMRLASRRAVRVARDGPRARARRSTMLCTLVEEQHVDLRAVADGARRPRRGGAARRWRRCGRPCRWRCTRSSAASVVLSNLAMCMWQTPISSERTALRRLSSMRAADAHHLARGLHLGGELVGGGGELVKGEARHLRHDVVQRRLEAGRGVGDAGSRPASCPRRSWPDTRAMG